MFHDIRKYKNLYIRELQSTLRDLHFQDDRIPLINIDGVFGPETTAAVKTAQRLGGFSETGRVDYEFWTWLFAVRDVGAEDVETLDLLGRIVRLEDRDSVADAVQTMLGSLRVTFLNLHAPTATGEYDPETAQALVTFSECAQLSDTVCCEAELLRLMARLHRQYVR